MAAEVNLTWSNFLLLKSIDSRKGADSWVIMNNRTKINIFSKMALSDLETSFSLILLFSNKHHRPNSQPPSLLSLASPTQVRLSPQLEYLQERPSKLYNGSLTNAPSKLSRYDGQFRKFGRYERFGMGRELLGNGWNDPNLAKNGVQSSCKAMGRNSSRESTRRHGMGA